MENISYEEVKEGVIEAVKRYAMFNADKVNEKSNIRRDHGLDSIKMVELSVDLEEEFGITFEGVALTSQNLATVELITNYVFNKLTGN